MPKELKTIAEKLSLNISVENGLEVHSPLSGKLIATIQQDDEGSLNEKIIKSAAVSKHAHGIGKRAEKLLKFASLVEKNSDDLAKIINIESGKTLTEATGEVSNFAATLQKTVKTVLGNSYDDLNHVKREKNYHPVGVVGVITSFNFPLAVAGWNIAPALLAGNTVIWKPSEKTPMVALAVKTIFDEIEMEDGVFDVVIGGIEIGKKFVAHEDIAMISATGSVAMGKSIHQTLAEKEGNMVPPILELGGNNAMVISEKNDKKNIEHAVDSIIKSFTGSCGQRCTNTRRVFVQEDIRYDVVDLFQKKLKGFESDSPLIDEEAFNIYQNSIAAVIEQGGEVMLGGRTSDENAFYVKPTLALMPSQTEIMHEECFAPLLYIVKYSDIHEAIEMVNAPANAGLVNGIYSNNKAEINHFANINAAGHTVINTATGTGTPAHGLGFGGNKDSGIGEILNQSDPLKPFTNGVNRIVRNLEVPIS